ncbi:MAG: hypothetical protein RIC03_02810 [Cyclobacteriaceae bacterium]
MKHLIAVFCLISLSSFPLFAQEVKVDLKNDLKPDIYIDGKKYDYAIVELLDQTKIESINVLKGEEAINQYNAPNGAIIIKSKKSNAEMVEIKEKKPQTIGKLGDPMIILDGVVTNNKILSDISPDDIESIQIHKGQKAIDEYNAPDGVIIIKTKKKRKRDR